MFGYQLSQRAVLAFLFVGFSDTQHLKLAHKLVGQSIIVDFFGHVLAILVILSVLCSIP